MATPKWSKQRNSKEVMWMFMLFIPSFPVKALKYSFPPLQGSTGVITLPPVSFEVLPPFISKFLWRNLT